MAAMNSSVLACSYAISGARSSELISSSKSVSLPSVGSSAVKMPLIRAQQAKVSDDSRDEGVRGRRAALVSLGAALFAAATSSSASAGVIEDALEKSKLNKVSLVFLLLLYCLSYY